MLPSNFEPQAGAVVLNKVLPVGTILPYGSETLPTDDKFLPCNGVEVLKTQYPDLFAIIGNEYGTPSSSGYFKLPNLQGRVPMGYGLGNDGDTSFAASLGDMQGYYTHTLNVDQIPSHSHTLRGNDRGSSSQQKWAPGLWRDDAETARTTDPETIQPTGGGASHNNIQPYAVTNYIIKAIPDEVIQYTPNITAGLSALNGAGQQTTSVDLSTTEIGLNVTSDFSYNGAGSLQIANCSILPVKLSQGAPRWNENYTLTTGNIFTNGESLNVNYWGIGDRNSYIDFHAQGTAPQGSTIGTGYDYDARLIREPGVNGKLELTNKGTGPITVDREIADITDDKSIVTKEYVDVNSPAGAGIGYGQTWKSSPANGDIQQAPNWGSLHTNDTGRPIQLSFTAWRNGQDNIAVNIQVGGYTWDVLQATNSGGGVVGSSSVIIPAGATYRFQSFGDTLTSFTVQELS